VAQLEAAEDYMIKPTVRSVRFALLACATVYSVACSSTDHGPTIGAPTGPGTVIVEGGSTSVGGSGVAGSSGGTSRGGTSAIFGGQTGVSGTLNTGGDPFGTSGSGGSDAFGASGSTGVSGSTGFSGSSSGGSF